MDSTGYPAFPGYGPSHHCAYIWGVYAPVTLLEGHLICQTYFMLDQSSFAKIQVTVHKQVLPFEQQLPSLFLLWFQAILWDFGGTKASKTYPFEALVSCLFHSPSWVDHWWVLGWQETTCPTMAFVGISMAQVHSSCARQRGTHQGPRMQFPIGCCGHHCCWQLGSLCISSMRTWTCLQCPLMQWY